MAAVGTLGFFHFVSIQWNTGWTAFMENLISNKTHWWFNMRSYY